MQTDIVYTEYIKGLYMNMLVYIRRIYIEAPLTDVPFLQAFLCLMYNFMFHPYILCLSAKVLVYVFSAVWVLELLIYIRNR